MERASAFMVFEPEVLSNTHDFCVRETMHNGKQMQGVFAKRALARCPLFLGVYPGQLLSAEEAETKLRRYAARHHVGRAEAERAFAYNFAAERYGAGCQLDPTDEAGCLLPQFASHVACYLNEAPPGTLPKVAFVYNAPRERYEAWLLRPAELGEELFTCYGAHYARDYAFNVAACATWERKHIPPGSVLVLDARGSPCS